MNKQIFIYIFFLVSIVSKTLTADITATLSQSTVGLDETFSIVFSANQPVQGQPDFSPLLRDFDILSTSQGQNVSIINGAFSQETHWDVTLIAKQEGTLLIPPISFGPSHSPALTIEVIPTRSDQPDDSLFLEIELHPQDSLYEQTELIAAVRLYTAHKIAQGSLSELQTNDPDTIIERLGSDREYELFKNGKRYIVVERKYALFPQHAGDLHISPIIFDGKIVIGRHSFFDLQTQFKRISSKEVTVSVKPIPPPFTKNDWFAARDLQLVEEWSADPATATLGEPLTWTLSLKAEGHLGSQLPTIPLHLPKELKHYTDKIETSDEQGKNGFNGIKRMKVALIPTQAGDFTLPEITLNWWDLKTDQMRKIQLPSKTLSVASGEVALQEELPSSTILPLPISEASPASAPSLPLWGWGVISLGMIGIILLFSFLHTRKPSKPSTPDSIKAAKGQFKQACLSNDPKQAELSLLAWGALLFPHIKPLNLMTLKQQLPADLQDAIDALSQALYGQTRDWIGENLWAAFSTFKHPVKPSKRSHKREEKLRELYPES